jgi:hypothetical protein
MTQVPLTGNLLSNRGSASERNVSLDDPVTVQTPEQTDVNPRFSSTLSDTPPVEGVLNPVEVEQSGYASSGSIQARTDTYENMGYDLPLDVDHDWVADEALASVWGLDKVYAVNGSFSQGYAGTNVNPNGTVDYHPLGWDANSTDAATYSDDVQLAAYDSSGERYVVVESQGGKVGQNAFGHAGGTRIVWFQNVVNTPYSEDFLLSFDYFYLRGPLDKNPSEPLTGNCSITVSIDGSVVWSMSLLTLSQRGVWSDSGEISISAPGAPSSFVFEIGLTIDQSLVLDKRLDYDNNGIADGIGNAAYITVFLDDVSFVKTTPPTASQVDLTLEVGTATQSFSGSSGNYSASVLNSSYWTNSIVHVRISANTSVSFTYEARLLSHRFTNSSWRTDISSQGVASLTEPGFSSDLTLYSYVGYLGGYEDPMMTIRFPDDWENATVSDPFLTDLTASCTIAEGYIEVPSYLMNRLGWWEVKLQSPNYAKSIHSEIHDAGLGTWSPEDVYRTGNETRAAVTIGTDTSMPASVTDVNVTWYRPNGVFWLSEMLNGSAELQGAGHTFGVGTSPAGVWLVDVFWTNGTEVAHGEYVFELHHTTSLAAEPSMISTYAGLTVAGIVRFTDSETGQYLTDVAARMTGSWPGGPLVFDPNPSKNWWEVQLDTSGAGAGLLVVDVNVTLPYYDSAACQIFVDSYYHTRLTSPDSPWTSAQWGSTAELTFLFEAYNYTLATWLPMDDALGLGVSVNWTDGYWSSSDEASPGVYTVGIETTAASAGTYLLNVTFSKGDYETGVVFLTIIISPMSSSLLVAGPGSARVDIDESYEVILTYLDQHGSPISLADVSINQTVPSVGLEHTPVSEVGGEPGNYSLELTARGAGVFTVRFVASEENAQPASTVFVLVVNDVSTRLDIQNSGSVEIGLTDVYSTTFRFEMLNGTGIDGADISIVYTGPSLTLSWEITPVGAGDYGVEFSAGQSGAYLITIAASRDYFQSASDAFFLIVRDISTNMSILNGTAGFISFGKTYRLVVQYTNSSGYGLDGANVTIESVIPETGLSWGTSTPLGDGLFELILDPGEANTFTMLVSAAYPNHQTQFAIFTLTATAIATSLTMLNTSTSISADQTFTVYLHYQTEDLVGLENATLSVQNPPTGLNISEVEDLGDGFYRATLTPLTVGVFDLVFRAELAGYQPDTAGFTLGATRIAAELRTSSGLTSDSMTFGNTHSILLLYERTDGILGNISGASISIQVSPATGLSIDSSPQGQAYLLQIGADRVGRWSISITAEKDGYALSLLQIVLDVEPIIVNLVLLSGISVTEGSSESISVRLTNAETGGDIVGALLEYRLVLEDGVGDYTQFSSTDVEGVYTAPLVAVQVAANTEYTLQFRLLMDNHELAFGSDSTPFYISNNPLQELILAGTWGGSIGAVLIVLVVAARVSSSRRKRRNLAALQVKKRFDDVSNILGVIVLHKKTGLPIYSKILRGGFDEAMVSAFVTAITHFRSEFGMDEKHWEYNVIPISDIVSAVPTKNLIVAFITVRPPSSYQEISMEAFGRATGAMFDDMMADVRSNVIPPEQRAMFDNLFYDLMDGFLLEQFHLEKGAAVPKAMDCLVTTASQLENGEGFKLEALAKGMATCGIEESHAYKMVLDAIERKLIKVANGMDIGGVVKPFIDREKSEDFSSD